MSYYTRFFLIDDDTDDVSVFKEVMQEIDPALEIVSAGNGYEALKILKHSSEDDYPDIIFLDLNMPRMGGKECLAELKKDAALGKIPVIIYTTSSQSKDIEEAMLKGAACFITKPACIKELERILSTISKNAPGSLEKSLRNLSNTSSAFIVC
ncbi:response regulator [Parafilimonas sp.]|uniref:response regulator n=1 Tax=Parafilimonas sp. TaxID=1969739 RepID=UPI0039E71CEF